MTNAATKIVPSMTAPAKLPSDLIVPSPNLNLLTEAMLVDMVMLAELEDMMRVTLAVMVMATKEAMVETIHPALLTVNPRSIANACPKPSATTLPAPSLLKCATVARSNNAKTSK